jgi:hypothetical protein
MTNAESRQRFWYPICKQTATSICPGCNCEYSRQIEEQVMNKIQTEKVRRIVRNVEAIAQEHEVGGWIEEDRVFVLVLVPGTDHETRLYSVDTDGTVEVYRNYAPCQLRDNSLVMFL